MEIGTNVNKNNVSHIQIHPLHALGDNTWGKKPHAVMG